MTTELSASPAETEEVGARLRSMMPFLEPVTVTAEGDVQTAKAKAETVAGPR